MKNAQSSPVLGDQLSLLYNLGAAGTLTDGQLLDRFLARTDPATSEAAFTALVERHGAMVLSICRQLLGDPHDAHDAFQATFLVLVSKAGSVRKRESVGGWLFGIARRVAARAHVEAARRRRHLREMYENPPVPRDDVEVGTAVSAGTDYSPLIDEIDRLPEQLRSPVILHYFEGLSTEATAQRLGCPRGTVLSRLSRARGRIKERLEQQGVSFAALLPAGDALNRWIPPATVPAGLSQTTIQAASSLGLAGAAIESVVPAAVATLSRGVARTLVLSKVRVGTGIFLLAVAGVSIGLAATFTSDEPQRPTSGPEMASPPRGTVTKSERPLVVEKAPGKPVVFRGKVTDADGKPVAGAEILLCLGALAQGEPADPRRVAASGPDGRFEVPIPPAYVDRKSDNLAVFQRPVLVARVPGWGPDWVKIDFNKPAGEIALRLRRDDVPIEGRVIGLEGQPIPGLTVSIDYIIDVPADLLKKIDENTGTMNTSFWGSGELQNAFVPGKDGQPQPVRTGPDGRFRLTGVGRDRLALLWVEGGLIERSLALVLTTSNPAYKPILLPATSSGQEKIVGPRFDLTVAPGLAIEGVVRDFDTRKPIVGAKVYSWTIHSTTDAQGRFLMHGLPKGSESYLNVSVEGQPYINVVKTVAGSPGLGPIPVEITLKRGVWVEGKVVNRADGRSVKAVVQYYPLRDNPHLKECPDAAFLNNNVSDEVDFHTDAEGRFRAVGLPGGGLLSIRTIEPGFLTAEPLMPRVAGNVLHAVHFESYMQQFQALMPINPPDGERWAIPDIQVRSGRKQHLKMIGPNDRPVVGVKLLSHRRGLSNELEASPELTFVHPDPGKTETLVLLQADRSLAAVVELKGDEPDSMSVHLRPAGTVIGRLVDEEGRPRPNIELGVMYRINFHGRSMANLDLQALESGPDGRFRIKNLVPGVAYDVQVRKKDEPNFPRRTEGYLHKNWWTVKSGEVQNWGDVQVKSYGP